MFSTNLPSFFFFFFEQGEMNKEKWKEIIKGVLFIYIYFY